MLLLLLACDGNDPAQWVDSTPVEDTQPTENQPPSTPTVFIEPSVPNTTEELRCTGDSTDPEGGELSYAIAWTQGAEQLSSNERLPSSQTSVSETFTCTVIATDPEGLASEPGSAEVTIHNAPPSSPEIAITPDSPTTSDTLTCSVTTESEDPDGHDVTYDYIWLDADSNELEAGVQPHTLSSDLTEVGMVVACQVNPFDNIAYGEPAITQVTISAD